MAASAAVVMPPSPRYVPSPDNSYSDDDDFEEEAKSTRLDSDIAHNHPVDASTARLVVRDAANGDSPRKAASSAHNGAADTSDNIAPKRAANANTEISDSNIDSVDDSGADATHFDDDSSGDDVQFRCERERVVRFFHGGCGRTASRARSS